MIEAKIYGIPCLVKVITCNIYKGTVPNSASLDDDSGFSEIEYEVCDRKGYPALWLEKKMTSGDRERIEDLIISEKDGY